MNHPPCHEPLRRTLLRTIAIALVVGAILAWRWGSLSRWPLATLIVLWFSFGGHWVEIIFLNVLRPRLPAARPIQISARLTTWFLGGTLLGFGMALTARWLSDPPPAHWPAWWIAGLAFIAIELLAHLFLQLRHCPSFYNGRG